MKNKHEQAACDIFDGTIKAYFAERHFPPPEIREQVSQKIRAAARAGPINTGPPLRWIWGVALYNFLVSAALVYALMLLFGPSIVVLAVAVYVLLSLLATVVIVTVSLSLWVSYAKPMFVYK